MLLFCVQFFFVDYLFCGVYCCMVFETNGRKDDVELGLVDLVLCKRRVLVLDGMLGMVLILYVFLQADHGGGGLWCRLVE